YNLKYAHALLYRNTGAFKFVESSKEEPIRLLDNYAAVWGDFNNDGQMDLLASGRPNVDVPHRLHLFENIAKTKNNWVKVRLIGMKSSKNPVASQVKVILENGVVLRQYDGVNGSYNQQNDSVLHFGVGQKTKIKGIEVRWSSGYKNFYTASKVNTAYVLKELQ
ncbi:MAG: CRTAC1 family protein, partial [Bacteriovoracaceae bacterium]|nr:CRTAC1 family protein [Bacteriovoracaceae bacterium]